MNDHSNHYIKKYEGSGYCSFGFCRQKATILISEVRVNYIIKPACLRCAFRWAKKCEQCTKTVKEIENE